MQYLIHTRAHSIEQQSFCESLFPTIAEIHSAAMKMHACNTIQQLRQPLCILRATALHKNLISGALITVVYQTAVYRRHENAKRRSYQQRILEVEHGSFTPLVFSATGGMGPAARNTYGRLASLLEEKRSVPYYQVIRWLCCLLNFPLY